MGGPSVGILLRHALTEQQMGAFEQWLASITTQLNGVRGEWDPLWLKDGHFIGMPEIEPGKTCAFGVVIQPYWQEYYFLEDGTLHPEALEEQDQLLKLLGYVPEQCISLWAGCNGKQDHQILGRLTLLIAQEYQGLIDFAGALTPHFAAEVEEVEAYIASLSFPGQVFHIYYLTGGNDIWLWHIVDVDFFRAWLLHPDFRLIK